MRALVTGATGMVGINLIEALAKEPDTETVALVRSSSTTDAVEALGASLRPGDMADAASLADACEGIDTVFHCAALVSDWGMREEMIRINVTGLRALLDSAVKHGVKRFVLVSSMAVLGNRPQVDVDESAPYVVTGDNYNFTKMEAEKLALRVHREKELPLVILRPPYIYGPHDRQFFPRLIGAIERGKFIFIGSGENPISLCFVGNLVDALIRAAKGPHADGRIYHITDAEPVTRRRLVTFLSDELGLLRPQKKLPLWLAKTLMHVMETKAKLTNAKEAPLLNRFRMKFLHTPLTFSIRRAQEELGYGPPFGFDEGMAQAIDWFKKSR
jgi:nucleoside-diphosphate-sugar epimerase